MGFVERLHSFNANTSVAVSSPSLGWAYFFALLDAQAARKTSEEQSAASLQQVSTDSRPQTLVLTQNY